MHRAAVIDVGTNSVILLIAEKAKSGFDFDRVHREETRITRLGEGMGSTGIINQDAIQRTVDTLTGYKELCREYTVDTVDVIGTEVFRQANNAKYVIKRIQEETDLDLEVLSGGEEAEFSFRSAIPVESGNDDNFVVIDIGGGSTEIIAGTKKSPTFTKSFKMGAVSLYEKNILHDPPIHPEIITVRSNVNALLHTMDFRDIIWKNSTTVGIGGTVTTLAAVHLKLNKFDPEKIDGLDLSIADISNLFDSLYAMSCNERLALNGMEKGREDIIVTGTAILVEFMEYFDIDSIRISTKGVRHGYLMSKYHS